MWGWMSDALGDRKKEMIINKRGKGYSCVSDSLRTRRAYRARIESDSVSRFFAR